MSKKRALADTHIHDVQTGWADALLICRKCSKKLHGGFGAKGRLTLRSALREALRATGRRGEIGLIETTCLGICPKRAITVGRAGTPGIFRIVPAGARAEDLLAP